MKFYILTALSALCFFTTNYSHVLIMTHVYNRPDFIKIQCDTFKKFLKDDYEFVVFNDAPRADMASQINAMCKSLNLECIRIPQSIHTDPYLPKRADEDSNNPAKRCAHVVQYSLDTLGFDHDDLVVIIDSDMFLTQPFSVREYMQNYALAGVPQYRTNGDFTINYIWNGLVFFDMPALPHKKDINFNCGYVENAPTDVGGYLYYYLKEHPSLAVKDIDCRYVPDYACKRCKRKKYICSHNTYYLKSISLSAAMIWLIQKGPDKSEFFGNGKFFHYRSGTNWNNESARYHRRKTKIFTQFIKKILP